MLSSAAPSQIDVLRRSYRPRSLGAGLFEATVATASRFTESAKRRFAEIFEALLLRITAGRVTGSAVRFGDLYQTLGTVTRLIWLGGAVSYCHLALVAHLSASALVPIFDLLGPTYYPSAQPNTFAQLPDGVPQIFHWLFCTCHSAAATTTVRLPPPLAQLPCASNFRATHHEWFSSFIDT